ncbi:MAG: FHA domain-containing protein [Planctomycetes bacterium]|nr:FHA domain-containing protein [Planctomycetota bacterium]
MARLVNLRTGETFGLDHALEKMGFIVLGRQPTYPFMNDGYISRFHATIVRDAKDHYLVDHSRGGTWYRGSARSSESTIVHSILTTEPISHATARWARERGTAQTYSFDRATYGSYLESLGVFLKLLDDAEQRKNLISLGVRLDSGMVLEIGHHENGYRFETVDAPANASVILPGP